MHLQSVLSFDPTPLFWLTCIVVGVFTALVGLAVGVALFAGAERSVRAQKVLRELLGLFREFLGLFRRDS
jgi:hypothetical protein